MNKDKDEIKKVLNVEMNDSICKCFTGRMSRLINCLNGFDELVSITMADNEQLGQIISLIANKLGNEYTVEKHRELVKQEMEERGYDEKVIEEWISYIE
jgi:hypothetical protein